MPMTARGYTYATAADYVAYRQAAAAPDGIDSLLLAASRELDVILKCSRYPVDTAGDPARPEQRQAVIGACCEIADWWTATGNADGLRSMITAASIGGVNVQWNGTPGDPSAGRIPPKAGVLLAGAGLIQPGAVLYAH